MHVCSFLLVIAILIVLNVEDSIGKKNVYPYDMTHQFNKKFVNMTIDLSNWTNKTRKNPPRLSPEIEVWLLRDLTNAMLLVKIKHVQSDNVLLDQTVNVCLFSKWRNNLLSKNLFDELDRNVDFKIKCPFKKGKYQVKSSPFSDVFFPSFIKAKDPFETTIEIKSKIGSHLERIILISHKWEILEAREDS